MLFWIIFLFGAGVAISPGFLSPTAPFNGLSILGTLIMLGAFIANYVAGGEEDDF